MLEEREEMEKEYGGMTPGRPNPNDEAGELGVENQRRLTHTEKDERKEGMFRVNLHLGT